MNKPNLNTLAGKFGMPTLILVVVLFLAACATSFIQSLGMGNVQPSAPVVEAKHTRATPQTTNAGGVVTMPLTMPTRSQIEKSEGELKAGWSYE